MGQQYLDATTHLPRHLAEQWSDRNIRLVGSAVWNPATNQLTTSGVRVIVSPTNGGGAAVSTVPDGTYSLSSPDTALWATLRRTAGTSTLVLGTTLFDNLASQPYPVESMVQIFYRTTVGEIVAHGNVLIGAGPAATKIGGPTSGIYDFVVGPATNPIATHQTLQAAIAAAVDGNRILILEGTYPAPATASNPAVDAAAAFAWSGKTLTIEGCGYGTVVTNPGALTRAFAVQSTSATTTSTLGSQGTC